MRRVFAKTGKIKMRETSTAFASRNPFRHYGPEEERIVRKGSVKKDEKLELLKEKFRECLGWNLDYAEDIYNKLLQELKEVNIISKDVTNFSLALSEFQDKKDFGWKAGLFLSAMIELSEENDFVVITKHLEKRIELLGYKNRKNIVVEGNAGDLVGNFMKGGEITVKGDAGNEVGEYMQGGEITVKVDAGNEVGFGMEDGEITVKGNARDWVGDHMRGGEITVEGNAGNEVGWFMEGGKITIEGEFGGISNHILGGKIYHKGKIIFE